MIDNHLSNNVLSRHQILTMQKGGPGWGGGREEKGQAPFFGALTPPLLPHPPFLLPAPAALEWGAAQ